jgi:predicted  nucleic acid-binding Zn-ribbon protein
MGMKKRIKRLEDRLDRMSSNMEQELEIYVKRESLLEDEIEAMRIELDKAEMNTMMISEENKALRKALHKISTRSVDNYATYAWEILNPQVRK